MTLFTILWLAGLALMGIALHMPDEHPDRPGKPIIYAAFGFALVLASIAVFIHQL